MSDLTTLAPLVVSLILAAGGGVALNAFVQRRKLGADATAVVTEAARELVDPLRKELANERAQRAVEVELERQTVRELRAELKAATEEAHQARQEARLLRDELNAAWAEIEHHKRHIAELEGKTP